MTITVKRLGEMVSPAMLPGGAAGDGDNIDGPSLIKVPPWVQNPLGAYYLYFASHRGTYIRLAYANSLAGPWTVYAPGTLQLSQCPALYDHIASPDLRIDDAMQQIVMYFHGKSVEASGSQRTFVATSSDGLAFTPNPDIIGPSYSRWFWHNGYHYLVMGAAGIDVYRSLDGIGGWVQGPRVLPNSDGVNPYARHVAVQKLGEQLRVFYTRKGDAPERILLGTIDLSLDWLGWSVVGENLVMQSETTYEGANLPITPSSAGPADDPEHALRDPAIFEEGGRLYMPYAVAGEDGIAIAELVITPDDAVPGSQSYTTPGTFNFTVPLHNSITFKFRGAGAGGGGDNTSGGSKATGGGVTKAVINGLLRYAGGGGAGAGDASPNNTGNSGVGEGAGLGGASAGKGGKAGQASGGDTNTPGNDGQDSQASATAQGGAALPGSAAGKGGNGGNTGSGSTHGGAGAGGAEMVLTLPAGVIPVGTVIPITVGAKGLKGTGQANGQDGTDGSAVVTWN